MSADREQAAKLRANGLTQREVAKQVGVSLRTVKRWEGAKGDRVPSGQVAPEGAKVPNAELALLRQELAALQARVSALEAERAGSVTLQPQTHGTGFRPHWTRDKDAQESPSE